MKKYLNLAVVGAVGVGSFLLAKGLYSKTQKVEDKETMSDAKEAVDDLETPNKHFSPIPNATESIDDDDDLDD